MSCSWPCAAWSWTPSLAARDSPSCDDDTTACDTGGFGGRGVDVARAAPRRGVTSAACTAAVLGLMMEGVSTAERTMADDKLTSLLQARGVEAVAVGVPPGRALAAICAGESLMMLGCCLTAVSTTGPARVTFCHSDSGDLTGDPGVALAGAVLVGVLAGDSVTEDVTGGVTEGDTELAAERGIAHRRRGGGDVGTRVRVVDSDRNEDGDTRSVSGDAACGDWGDGGEASSGVASCSSSWP